MKEEKHIGLYSKKRKAFDRYLSKRLWFVMQKESRIFIFQTRRDMIVISAVFITKLNHRKFCSEMKLIGEIFFRKVMFNKNIAFI